MYKRQVLYPYPDLKRIWTRLWLTPVPEETRPNLEVVIYNPDGTENCSVFMLEHAEARAETTLHLRNPAAGGRYQVVAELTTGLGDQLRASAVLLAWWFVNWNAIRMALDVVATVAPGAVSTAERTKQQLFSPAPGIDEIRRKTT